MIRLLGISGSLRAGSFNTAVLRNAAELTPPGASLDIRTLHGIPLYNADARRPMIFSPRRWECTAITIRWYAMRGQQPRQRWPEDLFRRVDSRRDAD